MHIKKLISLILPIILCALFILPHSALAASARVINAGVDDTLDNFYRQVKGAQNLFEHAAGALVFPSVLKAGFGVGGEYGEGALIINNTNAGYYSTAAASIGFQLGAQKKSILIFFMSQDALNKFKNSAGWKIGVDASVALIDVGVGGSIDTNKINEPIIGFVIGQKGLMYNLSLEGAKITRINR